MLRETEFPHLRYHGFVEGDDLGRGTVDVFVTEGFTGNIALKTAEGTAKQIGQYMREAIIAELARQARISAARKAPSAPCATRWTRAASMARYSSALTAS